MKSGAKPVGLILVLAFFSLTGCNSSSSVTAEHPAPIDSYGSPAGGDTTAPDHSPPFILPFPTDEAKVAEPTSPRQTAGTEVTTFDGAQTWQRGGTTNAAGTQLTLDPAQGQAAWAMYQFSGMADGDSVTSVDVEIASPGPENYWVGWSDYVSETWVWQQRGDKLTSTSVNDVFEPPAAVNPISYHGNVHIAVVAWNALPVTIYSVTLTAELNDVPVANFFANPGIGNQDLQVSFDASLSYARGGGSITDYEWDWDGPANGWNFESSGISSNNLHVYTEPGHYTPVLRVTDDAANQDLGIAGVTVSGWIQTWGGESYDAGKAVTVDESGNMYIAGAEHSFGSAWTDIAVLKYDRQHNLIWSRTFGGNESANDYAFAIAAGAGGLYIAGYTEGFGATVKDLLLLKYTYSGDLVWAETWNGGAFDGAWGVALSEDDYLYVAGWSNSFGNDAEALLLKFDLDGNPVWARTWGGANAEYITSLAVFDSETIYIAGETHSFGNGGSDLLLVKWNGSGTAVWGRTWGKNLWEGANAISLDLQGNIYLAGGSASVAAGTPPDVLAVRFTPAGNLVWVNSWGTSEPDVARAAAAGGLIPGEFYLAGEISIAGTDYPLLLKFETTGSYNWHRVWLPDSVDDDGFYGMTVGPGGVLLMTGSSEHAAGTWDDANQQAAVIHFDPAQEATAVAQTVNGTTTVLTDYLDESPSGVENSGGGIQDSLLLEFYPDDL